MRKSGIRKQVVGGKIEEAFEIKKDVNGKQVVTGHLNFRDEKKKVREVKEGK